MSVLEKELTDTVSKLATSEREVNRLRLLNEQMRRHQKGSVTDTDSLMHEAARACSAATGALQTAKLEMSTLLGQAEDRARAIEATEASLREARLRSPSTQEAAEYTAEMETAQRDAFTFILGKATQLPVYHPHHALLTDLNLALIRRWSRFTLGYVGIWRPQRLC